MDKKITAVQKLRESLREFSDATNNKSYRDKDPVEQDNEEISNALYVSLDKIERFYRGEYHPPVRTKTEELASKMANVSQALRQGKIPVNNEIADKFMAAIDFFDLAREAKEKGKTAAIKDKYESI